MLVHRCGCWAAAVFAARQWCAIFVLKSMEMDKAEPRGSQQQVTCSMRFSVQLAWLVLVN